MGGLRVHLEGYRAIAKADIALAELTVLTGVNASGKSTLARLFHHVLEVNRNFEAYAIAASIGEESWFVFYAFGELAKTLELDEDQINLAMHSFFSGRSETDIKRAFLLIDAITGREEFKDRVNSDKRIVDAFNRMAKTAVQDAQGIATVMRTEFEKVQRRFGVYCKRKGDSAPFWVKRQPDDWCLPHSLQIWDGDVSIFDVHRLESPIPEIYNPRRSIYIRHELGGTIRTNVPWLRRQEDKRWVITFGGSDYPLEEGKEVIPSEVVFPDGHFEAPPRRGVVGWGEWRYVRKDGATFQYPDCAEGIKALAPLQVLDSYGLLDSNTLLILDEPEVHLHPQWIVECAESLVNLVAKRQVRVLVASHSPYLIQALQRFAARALGAGQFRFYLAEEAEGVPFGYTYRNLGEKIGPIFKTFNVALDQIASYDASGEE